MGRAIAMLARMTDVGIMLERLPALYVSVRKVRPCAGPFCDWRCAVQQLKYCSYLIYGIGL